MKLLPRVGLILTLVLALLAAPLLAADAKTPEKPADNSAATKIAATITTVTGMAISPLLGTGAYGAYLHFRADTESEKQNLPWFAKPGFYFPALLIVIICAAKDSFGAMVPPGLKKPLDVLETIENKLSGLVAAGAIVPITLSTFSGLLASNHSPDGALITAGLATTSIGAIDINSLLNILTVPFGLAVYAIVWMSSHAINVLILLSPWGAIDAALKAARTALMGLVTLAATIDPKYGAFLSLIVIIVAYLVSGWAFRLTIFGSIFCWDFFTVRKKRFQPDADENWLFSGGDLPGVPIRSYGRIIRDIDTGGIRFAYKPWMFLPEKQTTVRPQQLAIGEGLFFSTILRDDESLFTLPPRYRSHEEKLAAIYALKGGVQPAGLRKAWSALSELFSGSPKAQNT